MGDSVAGKIRIDLLANLAQFTGAMRQGAREGFGGFQQEAQKFDRWFQSRAQQQKRMADESANWHAAMGGILTGRGSRGSLRAPTYFGEAASAGQSPWGEMPGPDRALRAHVRLRDSLPWGKSFRTTLSAEAAATAAAVGASKGRVAAAIASAARDMQSHMALLPGIGGMLGSLGNLAAAHPLATAGAVAGLGYAKHAVDRRALARTIKAESEMTGQTARDASLIHVAEVDPRSVGFFQRAMAERSDEHREAFGKLGLDPEKLAVKPMVEALRDAATGFERVRNAADRTQVAMTLFGRSGAQMMDILSDMNRMMDLAGEHEIIEAEDIQRVIAYDDAWKGAKNSIGSVFTAIDRGLGKAAGGHEISTTFARTLEAIGHLVRLDEAGSVKAQKRWAKEDYRIEHASEVERANAAQAELAKKAKEEAEARKQAAKLAKEQAASLRDAQSSVFRLSHGGDELARLEYQTKLTQGGLRPGTREFRDRMETYDNTRWRTEARNRLAERATPEEAVDKELQRIDFLHQRRMVNEDEYRRLRNGAMEDYYRRAYELDARQLARETETPNERFRRRLRDLDQAEGAGMFHENPQLAGRARRRIEDEARGALGIRNPERDYEKSFRDLDEAKRSSDEAFERRRREVGPMTDEDFERRRAELERSRSDITNEDYWNRRRELDRARDPNSEEYQRRQRALEELRPEISDEEYQNRRKELRKQAAEQLTPEARDVAPAAAMQVGSREAYSTLVQGLLGNQREQLQREANAKLDRIEQAIRERNGQQVEILE